MKSKCPTCNTLTDYSEINPFRPFCSERCRMIDLGDWLTEKHRIDSDEEPEFSEPDNGSHFTH